MTDEEKLEMETMKPRALTLNLTDRDVDRIRETAASVNLSVSELIENFIADLTYGLHTNGSDERMLAKEWLNRCWFGMFPERDLLKYLAEIRSIDVFLEEVENCRYYGQEFRRYRKQLDTGMVDGTPWDECMDEVGDKRYKRYESREEFVESTEFNIEFAEERWREAENSIKENYWEPFLEQTNLPREELNLETEIRKVMAWRENSEKELKDCVDTPEEEPDAAEEKEEEEEKEAENEHPERPDEELQETEGKEKKGCSRENVRNAGSILYRCR